MNCSKCGSKKTVFYPTCPDRIYCAKCGRQLENMDKKKLKKENAGNNWLYCEKYKERQHLEVCEKCRSKGRCETFREKLLEIREFNPFVEMQK